MSQRPDFYASSDLYTQSSFGADLDGWRLFMANYGAEPADMRGAAIFLTNAESGRPPETGYVARTSVVNGVLHYPLVVLEVPRVKQLNEQHAASLNHRLRVLTKFVINNSTRRPLYEDVRKMDDIRLISTAIVIGSTFFMGAEVLKADSVSDIAPNFFLHSGIMAAASRPVSLVRTLSPTAIAARRFARRNRHENHLYVSNP